MGTVRRLAADLSLADLGRAVSIVGFNHDLHAGTLSGFIVRQTRDVVDIHLDGIPETVAVSHEAIVLILEPDRERETEPVLQPDRERETEPGGDQDAGHSGQSQRDATDGGRSRL